MHIIRWRNKEYTNEVLRQIHQRGWWPSVTRANGGFAKNLCQPAGANAEGVTGTRLRTGPPSDPHRILRKWESQLYQVLHLEHNEAPARDSCPGATPQPGARRTCRSSMGNAEERTTDKKNLLETKCVRVFFPFNASPPRQDSAEG